MSFQTICRICINENPEMISVFASYNFPERNCEIFKVITDCASVQIEKCDGFSQQICSRCLEHLSQAYRFKKLCEDSDYKFRNNQVATDKIKTKVKKEEIFLSSEDYKFKLQLSDEIAIKNEFTEENTVITYNEAREDIYEIQESEMPDFRLIDIKEQCDDEITIEDKHEECQAAGGGKKARYKCNYCRKEFTFKSRLLNHIKSHTGEKIYKCELCEKTFREKANLTNHIRMHTGEKPYECEYCAKKFTKSSNLTEHIRMHTGEKPYKCKFCEKTFTRRTGLTKHIRVHTGEKNYKCEFCEKRFADGSSLVAHTRLHLGDKSFKCDVCEKTFTQSGHLAIHIRMHTGEKPFKCDVCERKFAQKSGLTKHVRIHTGEKPYKCDFCERRFACGGNLTIHVNRMHTEEKRSFIKEESDVV